MRQDAEIAIVKPELSESVAVWAKIGLTSFGGPAGQIALMHRELVEERKWISEERFLHALNYCMLLPGPEAQQLATYIGWLMQGWRGGMIAGLLFVIPGFAVILALSTAYALFNETAWLPVLFLGIKAAILAIVIDACLRVGKRALKTRTHIAVAAASFVALFVFGLPFPLVIVAAGLIGLAGARHAPTSKITSLDGNAPRHLLQRQVLIAFCWILVWQAPLAIFWLMPNGAAFADIFTFFSKMALVTFGGAYAVLAYVAQMAVEHYHWLKPGEMLDGLALAETTPGPLVLVLSFTGFLAAMREATGLSPLLAGVIGAAITAWATFVPSFIWIFAGAPYVERLRQYQGLSAALSMITAAVVGVILNLAVWFALHVLFAHVGVWAPFESGWVKIAAPQWATINIASLSLSLLAALLLLWAKRGMLTVLAICAAVGLALQLLFPN